MKYRAEINGLRAVAVIPVILFHAGFEVFSGGFIGVDIFFVISGYLITTIILSDMEQGTFSLVEFYERRARRILPALFFVMFFSLPFAWFWLLPSDLKDFSQSLVAVSLFSSNILFWQETGYWGVNNELKPLLHTWSLAVEEQYYILFPPFLMLMWRFSKRWIFFSFIFLALFSLIISQWGAYNSPTANFFLLPTRAWELAIGANIAFFFVYKKKVIRTILIDRVINEVLGTIGLALIGYSVFTFNETVPFPSFFALIPTIGTALIILFSSSDTLVGKLLGTKILVGIGLISYSAYLWHQPLFAFVRHRSLMEPSELTFFVLAFFSFPLAYMSWRYIEKPFRLKDNVSRKCVFMFTILGSALFIGVGLAGHVTNGFNGLSKNEITQNRIEEKLQANYGLSKECEGTLLSPKCQTVSDPEILIWGDSFAMHLIQGIMVSEPAPKIIQMTKSVCGPFFDIAPIDSLHSVSWAKSCLGFTEGVKRWLKENKTVKYVVLSSPFDQYINRKNSVLYRSGSIKQTNINIVVKEFHKTLNELESMGVIPIVFSPPPANGEDLGRCLAKAGWIGLSLSECNFKADAIIKERRLVYHFLDNIQKKFRVIRLDNLICSDGVCKVHLDSVGLYRDEGHLSRLGSAKLGIKYAFYNLITSIE